MVEACTQHQVGDYVECVSIESDLLTQGIVHAVRDLPDGTVDYVVQIQLTVFGIFRAEQLRQLAPADEEPLYLLVP